MVIISPIPYGMYIAFIEFQSGFSGEIIRPLRDLDLGDFLEYLVKIFIDDCSGIWGIVSDSSGYAQSTVYTIYIV